MLERPVKAWVAAVGVVVGLGVGVGLGMVLAPRGEVAAPVMAASPLPPGAPAQQVPAAPVLLDERAIGDWRYGCTEVEGDRRCSIMQRLSSSENGATVFVWRISQTGDGRLSSLWQTPNGVALGRGMAFEFGGPRPITIPYQTCGGNNCQAVATLAPDLVAALSTATAITATVFSESGQGLTLPLSTTGLADGIAALQPQGPRVDAAPPADEAPAAPGESEATP